MFNHWLLGELQKCRERGAKLHNIAGVMNDIHDTLKGSQVRHILFLIIIRANDYLLAGDPATLSVITYSRLLASLEPRVVGVFDDVAYWPRPC
jgi:hypothetical protein